ncbi:XIAP-associated factor 1 [Oreochromis aureus]|uniref:TRAF-type domain-containing protein n=1 Tax=Oreochromis aureus TaxID=47969 RepID=A0A668UHH6_OREAU|nr:XIAP-associated factor 1 [Oreochromis aureus]
MEDKEATRTCGQCHKEVAEANFALHETHCSRFLCVCPDCNESVPRDQLKEHREEQHAEVSCSKCNKKMERCQLMDHEADECVERLQACQFCDLEVPSKELDGHSLVCGSRTELCRDCGCYVRLRDQPSHGLTCSVTEKSSSPLQATSRALKETEISVNCTRCMASFPVADIDEHEMECITTTRWEYEVEKQSKGASEEELEEESEEESEDEVDFSKKGGTPQLMTTNKELNFSDRPSRGPWINGGDPDQISSCPYCHLALPVSTLQWHEVKCRRHICLN